jgi:hypothetical protein
MTKLRGIRVERDNNLTLHTTLASPMGSSVPLMWGWAARQLTGSGSFLDDDKAPDGGRIRNTRVSGTAARR